MTKQEHYAVYEGLTPEGDVMVIVYETPSQSGVASTEGYHVPVHLVPVQGEAMIHETSEACPCTPRISMETDDVSNNTYWVIRHGGTKESTYLVASAR